MRLGTTLAIALIPLAPPALHAQPTLGQLWPNADATEWRYAYTYTDGISASESGDARLYFDGTDAMTGAVVQRLFGETMPDATPRGAAPEALPAFLRTLWSVRPELRARLDGLATRTGSYWPFVLLPDFVGNASGVGFLETPDYLGGWRDMLADWSWWYLTDELSEGATFELQLIPDLADDVFLRGEIRTLEGSVTTVSETYDNAVIVDYEVDYGVSTIIDDMEQELGTFQSFHRGHVAYVPGVGPVALEEALTHEVDCRACDPEDVDFPEGEASLSLTSGPVPQRTASWGALKERWRQTPCDSWRAMAGGRGGRSGDILLLSTPRLRWRTGVSICGVAPRTPTEEPRWPSAPEAPLSHSLCSPLRSRHFPASSGQRMRTGASVT